MENNFKKNLVHIFDIDLTVIRKTSAWYFLKFALKEKIISFSQVSRLPADWIKYKLARPDMDFIENTVKKLAGLDKAELERISGICFNKQLKSNIYTGAAQMIENALKNNEKVIFATSSFDFIIKPLEEYFGIQGSLASQMEYSNGKTTGYLVGHSFFGSGKKSAAKAWMENNGIVPADVSFYSDSYTDIPLLEYCGNPVAVNPDRILARQAKKLGWKIMRFKEVLGN
ncbi:MAG: HAD-IB family hydrolase [Treponema sp.]|nr:HAD-IB family hydrolase [Treponema sp.]